MEWKQSGWQGSLEVTANSAPALNRISLIQTIPDTSLPDLLLMSYKSILSHNQVAQQDTESPWPYPRCSWGTRACGTLLLPRA